jgi:hypothetical protein
MRTLNIAISDMEFNNFGLQKENLNFSDFLEIIRKGMMRQNIEKCIELADKYGLSDMIMDEISDEVKAVRNAKNNQNEYE